MRTLFFTTLVSLTALAQGGPADLDGVFDVSGPNPETVASQRCAGEFVRVAKGRYRCTKRWDLRHLAATAPVIVTGKADAPAPCPGVKKKTCRQVTLTVEKVLKGSAGDHLTVVVESTAKAGSGVFFVSGSSLVDARPPDVADLVASFIATVCEAPRDRQVCSDLGAQCSPTEGTTCLCGMPLRGSPTVPQGPPSWSCEPSLCLESLRGRPCDGRVRCRWQVCVDGRWDEVPPPPAARPR
jgi:hypothetical protein